MMKRIALCFAVFIKLCNCDLTEKPEWLKSCQFKDPDFTKCSTIGVQALFDNLVKGLEGIEGLQSIDPMRIDRVGILQGEGPVSVNASISKVKITGISKVKVIENQVSSKDYSWITIVKLPKMRLEGNYHMMGRILVIPLNGRGKCWFEPSNMDIKFYTKTRLYAKNDHTFYNVTGCRVHFNMEGLKLRMDNLFEGVKVLEDSTNLYLNENWRPVSEALKPIISKNIEEILLGIMSKIFHQIPGDFFISDLPKPNELKQAN
ncbi:CLUMA_CG020662, isoform A [Clunio marinus]|uniref:CLUMA_CG020662, isoform A n=1 Tax=Clunio marinus TaxID=568069 RepID=A0A1J1J7F3_9DIPT|nr:CLUMA_CG020662, isoform A [Clunio marinus]